MSEKINDGGPAFPIGHPECSIAGQSVKESQGMTLRDWFAGMAMQQFVASRDQNVWAHKAFEEARQELAKAAFNIADAMIAQRGRIS